MGRLSVKTSIFEIFKVGIGPSSSHTMGPMRAAADFARELLTRGEIARVTRVRAGLYGSLALTGHGHGTDRAILLGLSGELPDLIEPETIEPKLAAIRAAKKLRLAGAREIAFEDATDLLWHKDKTLAAHSNGMRFTAFDADDAVLATQVYFSIGGGFILREGESAGAKVVKPVPFLFSSADELLKIGDDRGLAITGAIKGAGEREGLAHGGGDSRACGADLERDAGVRETRAGDGRNFARRLECETARAAFCKEIGNREKR